MIEGTAEMDFSYMFGWEMIGVILVAANMARYSPNTGIERVRRVASRALTPGRP